MFKAFVYTDNTLQAPNWVKSTYLYSEIKIFEIETVSKILKYKLDARNWQEKSETFSRVCIWRN